MRKKRLFDNLGFCVLVALLFVFIIIFLLFLFHELGHFTMGSIYDLNPRIDFSKVIPTQTLLSNPLQLEINKQIFYYTAGWIGEIFFIMILIFLTMIIKSKYIKYFIYVALFITIIHLVFEFLPLGKYYLASDVYKLINLN